MSRKKAKQAPKRILRLPDLDFAKSAVLNTLRSSESKRSYRLGQVSVQTTEKYLGCKQKLRIAVNDHIGIGPDD